MDALACHYVPDFGCIIKGRSHKLITIGIEIQTDNFCFMTVKIEQFFTLLNIPKFSSVVHGTGRHQEAMRIEAQTYNLHFMTFQGMLHLAVVRVPDFGCPIERASDNKVSEGIVECHCVHHVLVLL